MDEQEMHAQAIAEGYKDETCPKCKTLFMAHKHFVRCDADPCPMKSTSDPRSLLDVWAGGSDNEGQAA